MNTNTFDPERFVRAEEAARMAAVSPVTVRRWRHRGLFAETDMWKDPVPPHVLFYRLGAVLDIESVQRHRRERPVGGVT